MKNRKNRSMKLTAWVLVTMLLLTCVMGAMAETQAATFTLYVQPRPTQPAETEEPEQPTPTPLPAEEMEKSPYSTAGEANLRAAADGLSGILQTLPANTPLQVLSVEGDWVRVRAGDTVGYLFIDDVAGLHREPAKEDAETPNFKVTVFSSRRSVMNPGETVYLTSKIEGFDGYEIMYQWQFNDGTGFEDIPDTNADSYSFTATTETLSYDWRLLVYYR